MKKTLLVLTTAMLSQFAISQEEIGTQKETPSINPQRIDSTAARVKPVSHYETRKSTTTTISKRPGQPQRTHDVAYYNEEISKIDAHVASINTKIEYMNADPQRKSEAEANGWFQQMEEIKQSLSLKRAELVTKRDNL